MVAGLRTRRRRYLPDDSYSAVVAWLLGFDDAGLGVVLTGFQEFVELKFGSHSNVVWWSLALEIEPAVVEESDDTKVNRLLDLLEEYLVVDTGLQERRRLYHEWLALRPPDVDLLRFHASPAPTTVSVDDAMRLLGVDRHELFGLIHDGRLGMVGRVGAEVRIRQEVVQAMVDPPNSA
jgi:hypothetical protein